MVAAAEIVLVAIVLFTFWYQDWKYSLPAVPPAGFTAPSIGSVVELPRELVGILGKQDGRPTLLHFFNPECPCSRFNLDHVRMLERKFGERVRFAAILQITDRFSAEHVAQGLKLRMPAISDSDRMISRNCGVFTTPQAVVLDGQGRILFRGNYNLSRYCTAPETEFARIALEACLDDMPLRVNMSSSAVTAYGCPLPEKCRKEP